MDLAEKATATLEEERVQLFRENEQLQQQLAAAQDKQTSAQQRVMEDACNTHAAEVRKLLVTSRLLVPSPWNTFR